MMFNNAATPRLPDPPPEYEQRYFNTLLSALRVYFNNLSSVQQLNVATLNINLDTLPTEADVANLRDGDIYVDTTAGDVLKIKR